MEMVTLTNKKRKILQGLITLGLVLVLSLINTLFLAPNFVKALSYTVLREIAKYQFLYGTRHLAQIEGDHFIVRYYPKDKEVARIVLENAESIHKPVGDKLGFGFDKKVPVVIYPTRQDLGRSFGWEANESAMGVYWAGAIRILSPNEWIYSDDLAQVKEAFDANGPMAHEYTHLAIDYYTKGNYTRWFTEGIAQYVEFELTGFKLNEKGNSLRQPMYPFEAMDKEYDNLDNQGLAYNQSLVAVQYLVEYYGQEKLLAILAELKRGHNLDQSMKNTIGVDLKEFELNFKDWVKANIDRIDTIN